MSRPSDSPPGTPPLVACRETLRQRIGFALAVGFFVAIAEGAAAVLLGIREGGFFALQSVVAIGASLGLALLPVPRAVRAVLPWLGAGALHLAGVALEEAGLRSGAGAFLLAAHVVCAVVLVYAWRRLGSRGLLGALGLALFAQAVGTAALLFPLEQSARPEWLVPTGLLTVSVVPLGFGLLGAWVASRDTTARLGALVPAMILVGVAIGAHWPWTFFTHDRGPLELDAEAVSAAQASDDAPDVILIVMDATRADRLGLYGHARDTTPRLEELASTATVYERALTQGTWTLPGHASLFTGLYLAEHEADNDLDGWSLPLHPESQTLAEILDQAGYRTACVAANHGMFIDGFGLPQGFRTKWAEPGLTKHLVYPALVRHVAHRFGGHVARKRIGPLERNQFASAREINRVALRWLRRGVPGRERSFLFLNYMEVHSTFRREPCGAPRFGSGVSWSHYDVPNFDAVMAGAEDPGPEWQERVRDWYDSSIACLDLHLGELFDVLREMGRFDSSLIVVTSDHGQMLGEDRSFHHKSEVWEGLVHVPLIVKLPYQRTGSRCDQPVETADLARWLPRYLGIDASGTSGPQAPAGLESSSAEAPCPLGRTAAVAVSETRRTWDLAQAHPERWDRDWTTFVEGRLKYVQDSRGERFVVPLDASGAASRNERGAEVRRPMTADESRRFDELKARWVEGLVPPFVRRPQSAEDRERRMKSLRGLGYVGDDR